MVSELEKLKNRDIYFFDELSKFKDWEDKVYFVCSLAKNYDSAKIGGIKVQRCYNNAYVKRQSDTFISYSDSEMVSGLMSLFCDLYGYAPLDLVKYYQPKFIELLIDVIPNQIISNIIESFRKA